MEFVGDSNVNSAALLSNIKVPKLNLQTRSEVDLMRKAEEKRTRKNKKRLKNLS